MQIENVQKMHKCQIYLSVSEPFDQLSRPDQLLITWVSCDVMPVGRKQEEGHCALCVHMWSTVCDTEFELSEDFSVYNNNSRTICTHLAPFEFWSPQCQRGEKLSLYHTPCLTEWQKTVGLSRLLVDRVPVRDPAKSYFWPYNLHQALPAVAMHLSIDNCVCYTMCSCVPPCSMWCDVALHPVVWHWCGCGQHGVTLRDTDLSQPDLAQAHLLPQLLERPRLGPAWGDCAPNTWYKCVSSVWNETQMWKVKHTCGEGRCPRLRSQPLRPGISETIMGEHRSGRWQRCGESPGLVQGQSAGIAWLNQNIHFLSTWPFPISQIPWYFKFELHSVRPPLTTFWWHFLLTLLLEFCSNFELHTVCRVTACNHLQIWAFVCNLISPSCLHPLLSFFSASKACEL